LRRIETRYESQLCSGELHSRGLHRIWTQVWTQRARRCAATGHHKTNQTPAINRRNLVTTAQGRTRPRDVSRFSCPQPQSTSASTVAVPAASRKRAAVGRSIVIARPQALSSKTLTAAAARRATSRTEGTIPRWKVEAGFDASKHNRRPKAPAVPFPRVAVAQELVLSTVTARRFCDQHEMSLQTATGRSLPYEIVRMRCG
jgi:hypothetical protein